jgi:hypothetical protein
MPESSESTTCPEQISNRKTKQQLTEENVGQYINHKIREIQSNNFEDASLDKFYVGSMTFSKFEAYLENAPI